MDSLLPLLTTSWSFDASIICLMKCLLSSGSRTHSLMHSMFCVVSIETLVKMTLFVSCTCVICLVLSNHQARSEFIIVQGCGGVILVYTPVGV